LKSIYTRTNNPKTNKTSKGIHADSRIQMIYYLKDCKLKKTKIIIDSTKTKIKDKWTNKKLAVGFRNKNKLRRNVMRKSNKVQIWVRLNLKFRRI
jgi:hypothetical protein